jgi:hypothetical protein
VSGDRQGSNVFYDSMFWTTSGQTWSDQCFLRDYRLSPRILGHRVRARVPVRIRFIGGRPLVGSSFDRGFTASGCCAISSSGPLVRMSMSSPRVSTPSHPSPSPPAMKILLLDAHVAGQMSASSGSLLRLPSWIVMPVIDRLSAATPTQSAKLRAAIVGTVNRRRTV